MNVTLAQSALDIRWSQLRQQKESVEKAKRVDCAANGEPIHGTYTVAHKTCCECAYECSLRVFSRFINHTK